MSTDKPNEVVSIEELIEVVKNFSLSPGVYLMRDKAGEVLYVGKAKNLRARVRSYFKGYDERPQIEFLLRKISRIETIVSDTENQAFILERDLINKYKPRYNIRLKDNKEYLSVRLDKNADWPRLELVRQVNNDGAQYFGPYSFSYELKRLLELIKKVVPLRTCTDTVFYNRQRPCLEYQIKRCAGPCCLTVERAVYGNWIKQAISILEGKNDNLLTQLEKEMEAASEELRFEDAALMRDRINALQNAKENSAYFSNTTESQDVINIYREQSLAAISILRIRSGRIRESFNYAFESVIAEDQEIIETCLMQFYENGHDLPDEVVLPQKLVNQSLIEESFQKSYQRFPDFIVPQRGTKYRLLNLAGINAKQHFVSRFEEESRNFDLASELARLLKLKQVPRKIECVDISNLQGSDIVGGLVTFIDGRPEKSLYRRYNISFQDKPNDFAAIQEVVSRRLERAKEESDLPDLLIIDGGPLQLAKALEARDRLDVKLDIVALAKIKEFRSTVRFGSQRSGKRPERFFIEGSKLPIELNLAHPVTHFVQRIRDEVHRFVITFHRNKRAKRQVASELDNILGLGPDKRMRLLRHFGSLEAIKKAESGDLAKAGRMPKPWPIRYLGNLTQAKVFIRIDR